MNKVIILITAMALSLSLANAQQFGNGTGGEGLKTSDGSGPYGNRADMWASITEAAAGNTEILQAISDINAAREALAAARAAAGPDVTIEQFQEQNRELINAMKANVAKVQAFWRENREDRPTPVVDGTYQNRFRENVRKVTATRRQLRAMLQADPDNPECNELRQQLAQQLGERKQLLRDQRRNGGRQSGDGDPNNGG